MLFQNTLDSCCHCLPRGIRISFQVFKEFAVKIHTNARNVTQNALERGGEKRRQQLEPNKSTGPKTSVMYNASQRGIIQQGNLLEYRLKQDGHGELPCVRQTVVGKFWRCISQKNFQKYAKMRIFCRINGYN